VQHLHALLRSSAYDETVLDRLIDDEARSMLSLGFLTGKHLTKEHPTSNWMLDWDLATFIDALEDSYPLAAEDRHQGGTQKWLEVVKKLRAKARVDFANMNQLRLDVIGVLNSAMYNIGPIPVDQRSEILKSIRKCFSHRENPQGHSVSNDRFQRELDGRLELDPEFRTPTIEKLLEHITRLIYEWERDYHESVARTVGHNTAAPTAAANKQGKQSAKSATKTTGDVTTSVTATTSKSTIDKTITCDGCGQWGHIRDNCYMKNHRDFNATGPWTGSKSDKAVRASMEAKGWTGRPSFLHKKKNADGSSVKGGQSTSSSRSQTPTSPRDTSDNRDTEGHRYEGRGKDRSRGVQFHPGTDKRTTTITHLTCNCGTTQTDTTYRQCLVSLRRSTTYYTALTLFDTGAYTSFVNREVARWLEQQEDKRDGGQSTRRRRSRFDTPTAVIGLAGTEHTSSIYGTVVFDLTLFNEVTKSDNVLQEIEASVIDSCIEVIIGLPDIRKMRIIHRIPSYFDTPDPTFLEPTYTPEITEASLPAMSHVAHLVQPLADITAAKKPNGKHTARSRGARPCSNCAPFIEMGYSNTLCSLSGRPSTPQNIQECHPFIDEIELIKKDDVLDPIADDDNIEWPHNPYEGEALNDIRETPEELLAMITIEGSPWLQSELRKLCMEFIDVFATKVRKEPAMVDPMEIKVDESKWRLPCNRAPPRRHSEEKQKEIRKQIDALEKLGVIRESQATEWSQVHLVPKPDGSWRFTLDFVRLNSATGSLEGWPIPNIRQILNRLGELKPKVYGLIDFTAGIIKHHCMQIRKHTQHSLRNMGSMNGVE